MRRALLGLLFLCGAPLLPSCGASDDAPRPPRQEISGSGPVGVWVLDGAASAESLHEFLLSTARRAAADAPPSPSDGRPASRGAAADLTARAKELEDTVRGLRATLEFRADRTWTAQGRLGLGAGDQSTSGTWVEKDGRVVAIPAREEGSATGGPSAPPMVLLRQGARLLCEVPGAAPGAGLVFERR